ncbi:nucleoside hydrolase [Pelagicoccus sp. SDUM812003]|uniref:nucleoside hydrolase n=1 Tax=Pelagicoccus sp. SDUM812003 TaxID=3041267 RepID=UPI00280DCB0C|nr:nucleoside hydrolase [Pelagicoccus sp. SDUM812003]MDQ8204614.1 nucleoside hydrolase [Pelagicoccus sp. SDUM812003]
MQKVIIDSDWGGDVLQLASILAACPLEYDLLGATVTFGNASLKQNLENAGAMLRFLGIDRKVRRYAGAFAPDGVAEPPEGDDAHGRTGLGSAVLETSTIAPSEIDAVDFLVETIEKEPAGSIILVATGPQTNVARAIRKAPQTMQRLKEIRIMGGCTHPIRGYRVDSSLRRVGETAIERRGNITEHAEFNFQQASNDADAVLRSGIPIALFPMNCTHQLTFTPDREKRLRRELSYLKTGTIEQLVSLFEGPARIDRQKFDSYPVMHDVHTTVSLVKPELYLGAFGEVNVTTRGETAGSTEFSESPNGNHWVSQTIVEPESVFEVLLSSLRTLV